MFAVTNSFANFAKVSQFCCCCCSVVSDPWTAAHQASLSFTELAQTHVHWVSDAIQPPRPLSSPSPAFISFPASRSFLMGQLFVSGGQRTSFSLSISPSNEQPGLISFRMDWLDLLAVHGTLKSLLQHHSSEESIRWCLAFFMVQLSDLYMTTGDTITFTRQSFYFYFLGGSDGKVSAYNVGDPGSIPGSGRSPGEGNGNPLQYSCLENPMSGGAW